MRARKFFDGVRGVVVRLVDCPSQERAATVLKTFYNSTWSDQIGEIQSLGEAEKILSGNALGNGMEALEFVFLISGVSRAFTHQMVRNRIGVVFGQEGGRDNDWRDFDFTIPPTVARDAQLKQEFIKTAETCRETYIKARQAGIPYQDARFILPIGLRTHIAVGINFRALQEFVAKRLCNLMQWEINIVARQMVALVREKLPELGKHLKCACDKQHRCCAINPTLFPPCGLWPAREELEKREYVFRADANPLSALAKKDKQLGEHWCEASIDEIADYIEQHFKKGE